MKRRIMIIGISILVGSLVILGAARFWIADKKRGEAGSKVQQYLAERYDMPIKIKTVILKDHECVVEAYQEFDNEYTGSDIHHDISYSDKGVIHENIFGEMIEEKEEAAFQAYSTKRYFDSGKNSARLSWVSFDLPVNEKLFPEYTQDNPSYKEAYQKVKEEDSTSRVVWHITSQAHNKWEAAIDFFDLVRYLEDKNYRYDAIDETFCYKEDYVLDEITMEAASELFATLDEEGVFEYLHKIETEDGKEDKSNLSDEDKEAFKAIYEYTYKEDGTYLKCPYPDAGWE